MNNKFILPGRNQRNEIRADVNMTVKSENFIISVMKNFIVTKMHGRYSLRSMHLL